MTLCAGRWSVCGQVVTSSGFSNSTTGEIYLEQDGALRGQLTDGLIAGSWSERQIEFKLLYNAVMMFRYGLELELEPEELGGGHELEAEKKNENHKQEDERQEAGTGGMPKEESSKGRELAFNGTWGLESGAVAHPENSGLAKLTLILSATEEQLQQAREASGLQALPPIPQAGGEGNEACRVSYQRSVPVPCAMCDADGEDVRLTFFELCIPYFGHAELMSFNCAYCGWKQTKVRTGLGDIPPSGKTLTLLVRESKTDLNRHVVLSDSATVKIPALDLEFNVESRYSTVEGVVRAAATALTRSGISTTISSNSPTISSNSTTISNSSNSTTMAVPQEHQLEMIDSLVDRTELLLSDCDISPFAVIITDPLGLSFIAGAGVHQSLWPRTLEQNLDLGLIDASEAAELWANLEAEQENESKQDEEKDGQGGALDQSSERVASVKQKTASAMTTKAMLRACEAMAAEYTRDFLDTTDIAIDTEGNTDPRDPVLEGNIDTREPVLELTCASHSRVSAEDKKSQCIDTAGPGGKVDETPVEAPAEVPDIDAEVQYGDVD